MTQVVNDAIRRVLGPGSKVEDRNEFGQWIERNPEPEDVRSITQAGAEFVKLEMWEMKVAKPTVMEGCAVLAGPCEHVMIVVRNGGKSP